MAALTRGDVERLLELLNEELRAEDVSGEVYLVGGAVMCLVFGVRESTRDLDGFFAPTRKIREATARVAMKAGVSETWLIDAVRRYLAEHGSFSLYRELSHLKIFCADARYLLAMKCLATRIGEEFQDLDDIRYLLRHLDVTSYEAALEIIGRYYPSERFPQKALYALEEILVEGR